jgi:trimethylamine--corrinoid protein Co-methyltransferase
VIDNEMLGMAMRSVQGITVDEETLALEAIDRVGPGGHYLIDEHTLKFMRSEHYYPSDLFDRQTREDWKAAGSLSAWDHAKEIARGILVDHEPKPLDPDIEALIRKRFKSQLLI